MLYTLDTYLLLKRSQELALGVNILDWCWHKTTISSIILPLQPGSTTDKKVLTIYSIHVQRAAGQDCTDQSVQWSCLLPLLLTESHPWYDQNWRERSEKSNTQICTHANSQIFSHVNQMLSNYANTQKIVGPSPDNFLCICVFA